MRTKRKNKKTKKKIKKKSIIDIYKMMILNYIKLN
jgi:hypothetical protein